MLLFSMETLASHSNVAIHITGMASLCSSIDQPNHLCSTFAMYGKPVSIFVLHAALAGSGWCKKDVRISTRAQHKDREDQVCEQLAEKVPQPVWHAWENQGEHQLTWPLLCTAALSFCNFLGAANYKFSSVCPCLSLSPSLPASGPGPGGGP